MASISNFEAWRILFLLLRTELRHFRCKNAKFSYCRSIRSLVTLIYRVGIFWSAGVEFLRARAYLTKVHVIEKRRGYARMFSFEITPPKLFVYCYNNSYFFTSFSALQISKQWHAKLLSFVKLKNHRHPWVVSEFEVQTIDWPLRQSPRVVLEWPPHSQR